MKESNSLLDTSFTPKIPTGIFHKSSKNNTSARPGFVGFASENKNDYEENNLGIVKHGTEA